MPKEEIQTTADELVVRTEAAEPANRAKGDFLATMSLWLAVTFALSAPMTMATSYMPLLSERG
jgi:hypothetical protein